MNQKRMRRRASQAVFGILGMTVLLLATGCAASSAPSGHPPVGKAELDPENMQITFPVQKYGMTWRDVQRVEYANEILADQCMKRKGVSNPKLQYARPASAPFPDWTFGYWNANFTAQYGLGEALIVKNPGAAKIESSDALYRTYSSCLTRDALPILDHLQISADEPPTVVFTAFHSSYNDTLTDPRAKTIRADWSKCVQNAGVSPAHDNTMALDIKDSWTAEQLFVAVTASATCADSQQTVQKLANIAAGYQDQYIGKHEAQFVEIQKKRDRILKKVDQIIASYGG